MMEYTKKNTQLQLINFKLQEKFFDPMATDGTNPFIKGNWKKGLMQWWKGKVTVYRKHKHKSYKSSQSDDSLFWIVYEKLERF